MVTTFPGAGPETSAPVVLTVCTGNVCRSPLVERLLQQRFDVLRGPGTVRVRSAGTGALAGHAMDARSAAILSELGGEPAGFVARGLTTGMVSQASLVLTATREHRSQVVRLQPRALRYTFTVREFATLLEYVPDDRLPSWTDPAQALRQLALLAKSARASLPRAEPAMFDIADPYRQDDQVYAGMRSQVRAALVQLERVIKGSDALS